MSRWRHGKEGHAAEHPTCCGEWWNWRHKGSEEEVNVSRLYYHLGPCDAWRCAATEDHVQVCDATTAGVRVDDRSPCYHWRPYGYPRFALPTETMVMFASKGHAVNQGIWPKLQPRARFESVALLNEDAHGLCYHWEYSRDLAWHLRPHWCLRPMLSPEPYRLSWIACAAGYSPRAMVTSEPKLQLKIMSVPIVLPQLGFVLMSMTHVNPEDHGRAGPDCLGTRELILLLASCLSGRASHLSEKWSQCLSTG